MVQNNQIEQLKPTSLVGPLITKLIAVYEAVDHVEKRGQNKFQNYAYVKASDVARALRDAFKQQKIYARTQFEVIRTYTIPTKNEGEMQAVDVRCEIEFMDSESGATIYTNGYGSGTDKGDKAVYKAQTGAIKYALRNAFMIPDESDPEADEEVDRRTSAHTETVRPTPKPATSVFPPEAREPQEFPIRANIPPLPSSIAVQPIQPVPDPDPNGVPTPEEYRDQYSDKAVTYLAQIEQAGLKSKGALTPRMKFKKYLSKVGGVTDPKQLTRAKWEVIFTELEKLLKTDEGKKQAVEMIEAANKESK